eukprot:1550441-Rhodomonas_salina.1
MGESAPSLLARPGPVASSPRRRLDPQPEAQAQGLPTLTVTGRLTASASSAYHLPIRRRQVRGSPLYSAEHRSRLGVTSHHDSDACTRKVTARKPHGRLSRLNRHYRAVPAGVRVLD